MKSTTAVVDGTLVERLRAAVLPEPSERRRIREAAGATLRDFGSELGVTAMTVMRWEQGQARPRLDHAIAYRHLLDQISELAS